ncbi:MAG: hypothetical protein ACE5OQ_15705 [Woeseia sp.]
MKQLDSNELINRRLYPIDEPQNPRRASAVEAVRTSLAEDGCAVVRNFFSHRGLAALRSEAHARKAKAYYSDNKACNVYLGEGNPDRPDDHPQNIFLERTNGFIPADSYTEDTVSHRFYYWRPLQDFLADCLNKDDLFIYEDPVSNMIVNVIRPGEQFNWHFDTNEFTITMLLQAAESGSHFEYVPDLRNPNDECYGDVKEILDGNRSRVRRLTLNAGDLQLFLGRFSLHRVTTNSGNRDRLLLIMSFADKPGMVGNRVRVKDLYGKVTDAHGGESRVPARADGLLD